MLSTQEINVMLNCGRTDVSDGWFDRSLHTLDTVIAII